MWLWPAVGGTAPAAAGDPAFYSSSAASTLVVDMLVTQKFDIKVCLLQVGPPAAGEDLAFYSSSAEVQYDVKTSRSLNQRFTPPPGLRTMAVGYSA